MIFGKQPSKLAKSIADNMRRDPDAWELGSYRARHDTGLDVRTGNGRDGVKIGHPNGGEFDRLPRADKRLIWRAYRELLARKLAELVIPAAEDAEDVRS